MASEKYDQFREYSKQKEIRSFLDLIGWSEGSTYKKLVGGGTFTSFADHPRKKVWIKSIQDYSTAAGKYQFLESTWDDVAGKLGLKDFSPLNQDIAAVFLIDRKFALEDIINGDIDDAISKLSWTWASFPPARYKQNTKSLKSLKEKYNEFMHSFNLSYAAAKIISPGNIHLLIYFVIIAIPFCYGIYRQWRKRKKINLSRF